MELTIVVKAAGIPTISISQIIFGLNLKYLICIFNTLLRFEKIKYITKTNDNVSAIIVEIAAPTTSKRGKIPIPYIKKGSKQAFNTRPEICAIICKTI